MKFRRVLGSFSFVFYFEFPNEIVMDKRLTLFFEDSRLFFPDLYLFLIHQVFWGVGSGVFCYLENKKLKSEASQINHQMVLWGRSMGSTISRAETSLQKQTSQSILN